MMEIDRLGWYAAVKTFNGSALYLTTSTCVAEERLLKIRLVNTCTKKNREREKINRKNRKERERYHVRVIYVIHITLRIPLSSTTPKTMTFQKKLRFVWSMFIERQKKEVSGKYVILRFIFMHNGLRNLLFAYSFLLFVLPAKMKI